MTMTFSHRLQLVSLTSKSLRTSRQFATVARLGLHKELQALQFLHIRGESLSRNRLYNLLCNSHGKKDSDSASYRHLHLLLISTELHEHAALGDHLVRAFARYGHLLEASLTFCNIKKPSVHTWHAIISAHSVLGQSKNVLELFHQMQKENLQPNKFVYSCIAKACGDIGQLMQGRAMHEQIIKSQVEVDAIMSTTLIDMYTKCGDLSAAWQVFVETPNVNIIACNTLISGLIEQDQCLSALNLFDRVIEHGIEPSSITLLCILKACGNVGSLLRGEVTHDLCIRAAFEADVSIGTSLVDMYVKCKRLEEACRVFEALNTRNIISWNVLISGLSQQGYGHLAYDHFKRMVKDGIEPDKVTFSSLFSACGSVGAKQQGDLIYDHLIRSGLLLDTIIGNTLVDMYGKFGRLEDACNLFDRLDEKNVVTWNALINGYVQHGSSEFAVLLFHRMQEEGINPDNVTLPCIISACSTSETLSQGRVLHSDILKRGYTQDLAVSNALVHMYAEYRNFEDACKVFNEIASTRNVVSWNTIITGYLQQAHYNLVLNYFHKLLQEEVEPDKVTFLCVLKACENMGNLDQGMVLHDWVINKGLHVDIALANALLNMYLKCGCSSEACKIFHSMECRDAVSWGTMITGCSQLECGSHAIHFYSEMQKEGLELNTILLSCVLKVCGSMRGIHHGRLIHKDIITRNLQFDVTLENALIYMYAKCGSLEDANVLFAGSQKPDLKTWNVMISGYSQQGFNHCALKLFKKLLQENLSPNEASLSCVLNVCACIRDIGQGRLIHWQACENGYALDIVIGNTLVDMYSKCGEFEDAKSVLDQLSYQDIVAWNAMLGGLVEQGQGGVAVRLFQEMVEKDVEPNNVTFICILKACSAIGSLEQGKVVHKKLLQSKIDMDSIIGNSLIDMYVRCGNLEEAFTVFSKQHNRDVVSYNTMISGYVRNNKGFSALKVFEKMQAEGVKADKVTALCILKTCGSMGAVKQASLIHDHAIRNGFDSDVAIGNLLINTYAACGKLEESHRMFNILPFQDVVSWTSMISAYSLHGMHTVARHCLKEMEQQGLIPVDAAFTSILSACSHAGNVEEGYDYFNLMKDQYGIQPSIEHYNCMVQLLGQSGCLKEAELMLRTMPIAADTCSWMTLLIACRCFGNINMGKLCLNEAIKLDPDTIAGYVLLSNMYAESHILENAVVPMEYRKLQI